MLRSPWWRDSSEDRPPAHRPPQRAYPTPGAMSFAANVPIPGSTGATFQPQIVVDATRNSVYMAWAATTTAKGTDRYAGHAGLYSPSAMPIRIIPASLIILTALSASFAEAPRGIPRGLARQRAAQISNVRYRLAFVLIPKAATTSGNEELRFNLKTLQPVVLDFRDGRLVIASVSGAAISLKLENGHLEVPRERLRAGRIRSASALPCRLRRRESRSRVL